MTRVGYVAATYFMGHALYKRAAYDQILSVIPDNPTFSQMIT